MLTIDEAGEQVRTGPSIKTVATGREPSGRYHLASPDLEDIIKHVRQCEEAPIAETLLADAEHYALYPRRRAAICEPRPTGRLLTAALELRAGMEATAVAN